AGRPARAGARGAGGGAVGGAAGRRGRWPGRVAARRVAGVVGLRQGRALPFERGPLVVGDVVLVVAVLAVELAQLVLGEPVHAARLVRLGRLLELAERAADVAVPPHALRVAP